MVTSEVVEDDPSPQTRGNQERPCTRVCTSSRITHGLRNAKGRSGSTVPHMPLGLLQERKAHPRLSRRVGIGLRDCRLGRPSWKTNAHLPRPAQDRSTESHSRRSFGKGSNENLGTPKPLRL